MAKWSKADFPNVKNYGTAYANSGFGTSDFRVGDKVVCVGIMDDFKVVVGEEGKIVDSHPCGDLGVDFGSHFYDENTDEETHDLGRLLSDDTGWWISPQFLVPLSQTLPVITISFDDLI